MAEWLGTLDEKTPLNSSWVGTGRQSLSGTDSTQCTERLGDLEAESFKERSVRTSKPSRRSLSGTHSRGKKLQKDGTVVRGTAWVQVDLEELDLQVRSLDFCFDEEDFLQSFEIDTVKKHVQSVVRERHSLTLLRRHFQLEMWLPALAGWHFEIMPYDANIGDIVYRNHVNPRQDKWVFRVRLNETRNVTNCGKWIYRP